MRLIEMREMTRVIEMMDSKDFFIFPAIDESEKSAQSEEMADLMYFSLGLVPPDEK